MKKIRIFLILIVVAIFMIPTVVNAATITKAEYTNNKFTVTGTSTSNNTVQIALFDKAGNAKYLTTAFSDENGNFAITFPEIAGLSNGTYTIKTANYDGSDVAKEDVVVDISGKDETPKTGNFTSIVSILAIVFITALGIIIIKKNKNCANA